MSESQQHYQFQAEVARLLDLMVHSVYSEREVFLRELVSNAADALDKLRYEALTHEGRMSEGETLAIRLAADEAARTLTVSDNGIGMSQEELIDNLGTIARSGTRAFMESIKAAEDKKPGAPDLIGQFGVGFYSAFMVADRVEVVSRRAGADEAWRWSSDGKGTFDLAPAAADTPRGTTITLHLKEDASEFLQEGELRRIVHTYSDHISFPIFLATSGGEEEGAADNQLNAANALWTRPKSEISEEQYKEFYHHVGGMYDDPALTVHYTAEGRQAYTTLLFVPNLPPFDLYDPQRSGHIRLYVKRVFITDDAKLLPSYLRFVRGVVDSEDIPLNISREMLQNNPLMAAMRKAITGKVLNELGKCADNDADKFRGIWQNFGAVLKEGLYEDPERRDALYKLARFETTRSDKPAEAAESETPAAEGEEKKDEAAATKRWRSLADYVAAMQDGQKAIYYLTGDNREQLLASPQLEGYLARGLEVLLLSDPVDAFWVTTAAGYEGKPFRSITQGSADLAEIPLTEEAAKDKGEEIAADALIDKLKSVLGDEVSDVQKSARLIGSPACLIAPAFAPDRQMEKLMQRQQGGKSGLKPILEINAGHALAHALNDSLAGNKDERFADLAFLLLDEARILEGGTPADPAKFAERLNRLVTGG